MKGTFEALELSSTGQVAWLGMRSLEPEEGQSCS